ncbi:hypothetical protein TWF173_008563 [Orbilia oligospora]|nr:hypothetical protein TWF173_008563 [Orbilia oligospora]
MHFSTLLTTATVALVGLTDITSAHAVIMDAWGSNNPKLHGWGLGFSYKNTRRDPLGRLLDVAVFDRTVFHDRNNATYLNYGCGFSGNSVGWHLKTNKPGVWNAQKRKKTFFERKADPEGRINVPRGIEGLALHENKGNVRRRWGPQDGRGVRTGIPKVVAGKTMVVMSRTIKGNARILNCRIDYNGNGKTWTRHLKRLSCGPAGRPLTAGCSANKLGKVFNKFRFQLPPNMDCRGSYGANKGIKNICIVRCQEGSLNGPFGGCVAIQQRRPKPVRTVVVNKTVGGKTTRVTQFVTVTSRRPVVQPVTTVTSTIVETITRRPPPRMTVRVVTVVRLPHTYTVYIKGKATPTKATKVNQVITETVTVSANPVIETVTVVQKDEFEDETGGTETSEDDDSDPDLKDQPDEEDGDVPADGDNTPANGDDGNDDGADGDDGDNDGDVELDEDAEMGY